jgi:hypothetical protein
VITNRKNNGLPAWGINEDYWVRLGEEPFIDRKILVICPWFAIFVSDIHQPDQQRDPHDHSRGFISFILNGGYMENLYRNPGDLNEVETRCHKRWSVHVMNISKAHSIVKVTHPLRTLVFAGKTRGTWSFWTAAGKIDWKKYDNT